MKRSSSKREESIREEIELGFGDKLENEFDSSKILNGLLRFLRGKEEENERNKSPQKPGGIGLGFGRNRSGKRRLGFGLGRRRPEVGDDPDRWGPHVRPFVNLRPATAESEP